MKIASISNGGEHLAKERLSQVAHEVLAVVPYNFELKRPLSWQLNSRDNENPLFELVSNRSSSHYPRESTLSTFLADRKSIFVKVGRVTYVFQFKLNIDKYGHLESSMRLKNRMLLFI